MASSNISLILCYLVVVSICAIDVTNGASSSQNSPTPTNSADCSSLVVTMADCLSFVQNDSTLTKPEGQCCSSLKTVLKDAPTCLCEVFKSSSQLGVALNVTKALSLPDACKLSAPPLSNCGLSEAPGAAPGGGSLTPKTSPPSGEAPVIVNPGVNEPSVAPTPSKAAASALLPISAGSLLVCILSVISGL